MNVQDNKEGYNHIIAALIKIIDKFNIYEHTRVNELPLLLCLIICIIVYLFE